jgi:hypothetical protein
MRTRRSLAGQLHPGARACVVARNQGRVSGRHRLRQDTTPATREKRGAALCYRLDVDEMFEFLVLITERLDRARTPYMLSGSVALSVYAQPRMTRDIDFVIDIEEVQVDQFVRLFEGDCYVDRESVLEAVRLRGMFNIIHQAWVLKADFVVRKDEPFRKTEFERRRNVSVAGKEFSIVTAEDLLLSKLHWAKASRSELQLGDVKNLILSASNLDWSYIRHWAKTLGVVDLLGEVGGNDV